MGRGRQILIVLLAVLLFAGTASGSHLTNTVPIDGEVPFSAPSGPSVTLVGPMDVNMTNMFPATDTVRVWSTKGNITVSGADGAAVTVDEINGTWTNTSSLGVVGKPITMDPGDKAAVTLSGDLTRFDWRAGMAPDDGTPDFAYTSSLGAGSVTLTGLPANTEIAAVDPSTHNVLDVATTDGTGSVTYSSLPSGGHNVELMTSQGGPVVNDASASPTGGLSSGSQTLSIDVSDADFPNDQVTVEFFKDGASIGTDTLSSNGTATQSATFSLGGSHTWHVEATDEYGATDTSSTFAVQTPSEIRIYNESAPTHLVDNATVELRFYVDEGTGAPKVYDRNTTTGTVDMTGLPADKPFIVVASANGYYSRRIFVPSLFETQKVYLLPENATAVPVTFAIEDYTGDFPQATTVLLVQRALNGSYQTVLGDYFGATGQFPATLAYNQRHRLVLYNTETGQKRTLGAFTPQATSSQRVVVSPSGIVDITGIPPTIAFPEVKTFPAVAGMPFNASITKGSEDIQSWNLTISANGTTLYTDSGAGGASIDTTLNLTAYPGGQVNATMTYTLSDGTTDSKTATYTIAEAFSNDDALLPGLIGGIMGLVPSQNQHSFGVFLAMVLTVIGTAGIIWAVPMPPEFIGVTAWLFLAAFAVIGWVGYDMLFVAGVGAASFAYLRRVN